MSKRNTTKDAKKRKKKYKNKTENEKLFVPKSEQISFTWLGKKIERQLYRITWYYLRLQKIIWNVFPFLSTPFSLSHFGRAVPFPSLNYYIVALDSD